MQLAQSAKNILSTGQTYCYDARGARIDCAGSGQDGELQIGLPDPDPRFEIAERSLVIDNYTGLSWPMDLNDFAFPLSWKEAWETVQQLNQDAYLGYRDWRLPDRRELNSLICYGCKKPVLPWGHPFVNVQQTWYWTSTTSAMYPDCAWYIHMAGGRMFWGRKSQFAMFWPVRGQSKVVPATGQRECYDQAGIQIGCLEHSQFAEPSFGLDWPESRFVDVKHGILDRLTDLVWYKNNWEGSGGMEWQNALSAIAELANSSGIPWHLPNINELESLVDASAHTPALPDDHPFNNIQEVYWSSTNSSFEPDWAYSLYMYKGGVGVGKKNSAKFAVWPVALKGDLDT